MSKKSRRKRKNRRRKGRPRVSRPRPQPKENDASKSTLLLTILGLVVGAVGLWSLVELLPRPNVSYSPPSDASDPLSTRWTVTNDGYVRLTEVGAICFIWRMQADIKVTNSAIRGVSAPNPMLPSTEGFTVPCEDDNFKFVGGTPQSIDLAVVVYYRPWPFTFVRSRKMFRFVERRAGSGVVWDKQPASVMEKEFNEFERENSNLPIFQ